MRASAQASEGEMVMAYEWFWLVLAVGVFAAVALIPVSLVFDALSAWREQRRARLEQQPGDAPEST